MLVFFFFFLTQLILTTRSCWAFTHAMRWTVLGQLVTSGRRPGMWKEPNDSWKHITPPQIKARGHRGLRCNTPKQLCWKLLIKHSLFWLSLIHAKTDLKPDQIKAVGLHFAKAVSSMSLCLITSNTKEALFPYQFSHQCYFG